VLDRILPATTPGEFLLRCFLKLKERLEDPTMQKLWRIHGTLAFLESVFARLIALANMTIDQFVADLHELVRLVTKRFGQRKVFLAGQSVGTVFGLLYARQHPELVHGYVGINQVVDRAEEKRISYVFTREARQKSMLLAPELTWGEQLRIMKAAAQSSP
jgi:pimeloyl-ACP methyl ester carboxylesterase